MNLRIQLPLLLLGLFLINASTALAVGENLAGHYQFRSASDGTGNGTLACPDQVAITVEADSVAVLSSNDSFDRRYSMSGFNQGIYGCHNNGGIFNECSRTSGNRDSITTDIGEDRFVYFTVDFSYSIRKAPGGIQFDYKNEQSAVTCNYSR